MSKVTARAHQPITITVYPEQLVLLQRIAASYFSAELPKEAQVRGVLSFALANWAHLRPVITAEKKYFTLEDIDAEEGWRVKLNAELNS